MGPGAFVSLTNLSWTLPVLVGTQLFIRDRKTMMAVDMGCFASQLGARGSALGFRYSSTMMPSTRPSRASLTVK